MTDRVSSQGGQRGDMCKKTFGARRHGANFLSTGLNCLSDLWYGGPGIYREILELRTWRPFQVVMIYPFIHPIVTLDIQLRSTLQGTRSIWAPLQGHSNIAGSQQCTQGPSLLAYHKLQKTHVVFVLLLAPIIATTRRLSSTSSINNVTVPLPSVSSSRTADFNITRRLDKL